MATINIAELALTLDASPREVRKFMRTITPADEQPGKGGRWAIEKRAVRSLTKKFADWQAERAPEVSVDDDEVSEEIDETASDADAPASA